MERMISRIANQSRYYCKGEVAAQSHRPSRDPYWNERILLLRLSPLSPMAPPRGLMRFPQFR